MSTPLDLFCLIKETDKLKSVYRRSYIYDSSRNENSAEHSWHLCIALLALQSYMPKSINIDHAIKIALIHDLCEIGAGDISVYSKERLSKAEDELEYMNIFSNNHGDFGAFAKELWLEYEAQISLESKWVKIADRILPFMHNIITEGKTWLEQGIKKEQVLKLNMPIKSECPELYSWIELEVNNAANKGWL